MLLVPWPYNILVVYTKLQGRKYKGNHFLVSVISINYKPTVLQNHNLQFNTDCNSQAQICLVTHHCILVEVQVLACGFYCLALHWSALFLVEEQIGRLADSHWRKTMVNRG